MREYDTEALKTVLAPWAYLASVLYHDVFWYPVIAKKKMAEVLDSVWGRLFANWSAVSADEQGYALLCDFGYAKQIASHRPYTKCGTDGLTHLLPYAIARTRQGGAGGGGRCHRRQRHQEATYRRPGAPSWAPPVPRSSVSARSSLRRRWLRRRVSRKRRA